MTKEEFERIQKEQAKKEREKKEKMYEETDKILNDRLPGWDKEDPCQRCGGTGFIGYTPVMQCPSCNLEMLF